MPGVRLRSEGRFIATIGRKLLGLSQAIASGRTYAVAGSESNQVRPGLVHGLARPGGNITGNTILGTEMAAKRVQLLKEFIPRVSRVAFLWNPNNPLPSRLS
jgi:ABC-type uncharacterized transport system substrate-binding protein